VSPAGDAGWIIGVDTHLDSHTAAACSAAGQQLALAQIPATLAGYAQLLGWARAAAGGGQVAWAIEGTRSYGAGLARYLAAAGEQVAEIDGGHCLGKRRAGKSDAIDAVRAARTRRRCAPTGPARRCGCCSSAATTRSRQPAPPAPHWPRSWSPRPPRCASNCAAFPPNAARPPAPPGSARPAPTSSPAPPARSWPASASASPMVARLDRSTPASISPEATIPGCNGC